MQERVGDEKYASLSSAVAHLLEGVHELEGEAVRVALYAYAGGEEIPRGVSEIALFDAGRIAIVRAGLTSPIREEIEDWGKEIEASEDPFQTAVKFIYSAVDRLQDQLDWEALEDAAVRATSGGTVRIESPDDRKRRWFAAWQALVRWRLWGAVRQAFGLGDDWR
jgi:hypothetical protein